MTKEIKTDIDEIKESIDSKKIILGTHAALKALKLNKIKKIFVSTTCQQQTMEDLHYYATFQNIPVVQLHYPSDEVGVLCKKPFAISVLGIAK